MHLQRNDRCTKVNPQWLQSVDVPTEGNRAQQSEFRRADEGVLHFCGHQNQRGRPRTRIHRHFRHEGRLFDPPHQSITACAEKIHGLYTGNENIHVFNVLKQKI